jgi:MFS family permease
MLPMQFAKKLSDKMEFYYGWIIVAVALVSMAFWFGIRSNFSVFYVALLEDFGWNRGASAGAQSMALITYTAMAPLVGGLIDRFGPRRVVVPGILILVIGLILCRNIESLSQFYIYYGVVVGTGITCIGIVTYSAILAHWFEKRRGLASGIALSGIGLGTFVLVPLSQSFISMWGWRLTFVILGGLVLIIVLPLNALFLRHKPSEIGQYVDGLENQTSSDGSDSTAMETSDTGFDWTTKKVMTSGRFWALIGFTFFAIIYIYIVMVHGVRFMVDQGVDKMTAAFILALVGVISSIFRIFWGWLSDRIGREMTYTMGTACGCLGVGSLLLFEAYGSFIFIYSFFVFFGMGWGVTAPMMMAVSADLFKGKIFGLIYGFVEAGVGIGAAFGSWVAGFIFDQTQSYQMAFVLCIVSFLLSCLFCWLAAPRKYRNWNERP